MVEVQIESISRPLAASPRLTRLGLQLLSRAQVMGFLPADVERVVQLDAPLLERVTRGVRAAGIAAVPAFRVRGASAEELERVLGETLAAVDASPHPRGEWQPAREILGDDLLARLVGGISPSSLRRYAAGLRETPDDVAWRLHVVARLLASLLGSYNAYGIRRWFERPRTALAGRTPADAIAVAAHEEDPSLDQVFALAERLVGAGAAV